MTRVFYDSTNIYDIPTSAKGVGFYVDGIYAVAEAVVRARFPSAVLVPISAVGTNAGIVGDVEKGCIWPPAAAVPWVVARRKAGVDPTIYCNQTYDWQPVQDQFTIAHVPQPHYWVANYDRVQVIPKGAVAKQFTNPTYSGGHYDLSVVADFWPGIDTAEGDDFMATVSQVDADVLIWTVAVMAGRAKVTDAPAAIQQYLTAVKVIPTAAGGATDNTAVLAAIADLKAIITKIETALKGA